MEESGAMRVSIFVVVCVGNNRLCDSVNSQVMVSFPSGPLKGAAKGFARVAALSPFILNPTLKQPPGLSPIVFDKTPTNMGISISSLQADLNKSDLTIAPFLGSAFPVLWATHLFKNWFLDSTETKNKARLDDFVALGLAYDLAKKMHGGLPEASAAKWGSIVWLLPLVAAFRNELSIGVRMLMNPSVTSSTDPSR